MKFTFTSRTTAAAKRFGLPASSVARKLLASLFMFSVCFQSVQAESVYAVSGTNLIGFNSAAPGTITSTVALSGVASGQVIEGLDFRPATGQLYALGYVASSGMSQLYVVNYKTGVATAVGTPVMLAANMVRIGMDFNPTVDRVRVTSFSGQNYRLNPITGGMATVDTQLSYAAGDVHTGIAPRVEAVAYTNSFPGATATTIYYYDYGYDDLVTSAAPNGGVLNTVGNTSVATTSGAGLDIDIVTNTTTGIHTAFLSARVAGTTNNFYSLNLTTGKASLIGTIGTTTGIDEMAVLLAPPTPKIIYAISTTGNLVSFNSNAPSTILTTDAISGITSGQVIEGIDFRPATGQLFALGYASGSGQAQVYTIDTVSGAATTVGAAIMLATGMTNVGVDFNPTVDRIRVTAATGQNYRLNPITGALQIMDGNLSYAPGDVRANFVPAVATVAYTNSFPGSTATTIYYYDFGINSLALSTNPNGGVLTTVGTSGISPISAVGLDLDISANPGISGNIGYLSANVSGTANSLYTINLASGGTSLLGTIGSGISITDIAVYSAPPAPAKRVYALSGNNLIRFNSDAPGTIRGTVALTGITAGQTVEGIDFRPANDSLYAFGYNAGTGAVQIYRVDTATGAAIAVGGAVTLPTGLTRLGVDFNPMADRLRVTSDSGRNYRFNPINGALAATDSTLRYTMGDANFGVSPNVNAVGYSNNVAGATFTSIYYYDFGLDALATSSTPNLGTLSTLGRTGLTTLSASGLDMDIVTDAGINTAFLSATVSGMTSNFYTLNLATGEPRLIGTIGATITDFAVSRAASNGNREAQTLPVTLVNFSGRKSGNSSQLSWTTRTESNNSHFILERSADGVHFTAASGRINSAAAEGNSSAELNYNHTDFSPVKGINYYRLLQVDKNGKSVYSQTVQIRFNGGYEITTYPNPITSVINVNGFISEKADLQIKLTDINGRTMTTTQLKNQSGNWNTRIKADGLRSGLYYVTVTKGNTVIHTETVQKN